MGRPGRKRKTSVIGSVSSFSAIDLAGLNLKRTAKILAAEAVVERVCLTVSLFYSNWHHVCVCKCYT